MHPPAAVFILAPQKPPAGPPAGAPSGGCFHTSASEASGGASGGAPSGGCFHTSGSEKGHRRTLRWSRSGSSILPCSDDPGQTRARAADVPLHRWIICVLHMQLRMCSNLMSYSIFQNLSGSSGKDSNDEGTPAHTLFELLKAKGMRMKKLVHLEVP